MTDEQVERAIEFLLEHHAKFSADMEQLKEAQKLQAENINRLFETTTAMQVQAEGMQSQAEADRAATRDLFNSMIAEMQEGFNKLILSNEVTRDLASKVAALEVQTSQRVTGLEQRVSDIESNL